MEKRKPIPPHVGDLLSAQDGVIARQQALSLGVTPEQVRRLISEGWWTPFDKGIYLHRLTCPQFIHHAWAGVLRGGGQSALGGQATLYSTGIGREPDQIVVVIPPGHGVRLRTPLVTLRDGIGRLSYRRGSPSRIRAEDAIVDLAAEISLEAFVGLVTDSIRARVTSALRVERVLKARQRMRRRGELMEVLADLQGIESNLEFRYRRDVERAHRLPRSQRQVARGRSRFDFYYEEYGVVVETDGRLGHVEGRFRDLRRDNWHAASGLLTMRYGSYDIRSDPCAVAAQVAMALQARGWAGGMARCPSCYR